MLNTPHLLVGASIGVATGNPVAGFVGGIASHYLLDIVPHTDPGTLHYHDDLPYKLNGRDWTIGFADLAVSSLLLIWLAGQAPIVGWAPLAGMIGGILPDIVGVAGLIFPQLYHVRGLDKYYELTRKYHHTAPPERWIEGTVWQLLIIGLALWFLLGS